MTTTFTFELISPEKVLISQPVAMATIPGADGYLGILPNHAPLMTILSPGVVSVKGGESEGEHLFIAGGFAEITQTHCTVLAEQVIPVSNIDRNAVESDLKAMETEPSTPELEKRRAVAVAKLEALKTAAH